MWGCLFSLWTAGATWAADDAGATTASSPVPEQEAGPVDARQAALGAFTYNAAALVWCRTETPARFSSGGASGLWTVSGGDDVAVPMVSLGPSRLVRPTTFVAWSADQRAAGLPVDTATLSTYDQRRSELLDDARLGVAVQSWNIWLLAQTGLDPADLPTGDLDRRATQPALVPPRASPSRRHAAVAALPRCS